MATFIVTSHGRSGTHWLARELNRSRKWLVGHEWAIDSLDPQCGTVNSYLRHEPDLVDKADKVAVILRDPEAIARSVWGKAPKTWDHFISKLPGDLRALDALADSEEVVVVNFQAVTTSSLYLRMVAWQLGVTDILRAEFDMKSPGSTSRPISVKQRNQVRKVSGWFTEKWRLG